MKREYTVLVSLVILSTNTILATDSMTLDDFYKKAFGDKSSNSKSKIFLPMVINGKIHTEVFLLRKGGESFIKEDTAKYIVKQIKSEYRDLFSYKVKKDGYISTQEFSKEGLNISFDEEMINLKIIIPPKLRRVQDIDFQRRRSRKDGNITIREDYAGGASFYLNQGYSEKRDKYSRNPLTGSSELFLNAHDFVLEGELRFNEAFEEKIRRDRVRLTRDDESTQLRYRMGDIYLPQVSRISRVESLGVSVEKILGMDENYHQNISRINSFEFFLKNRSRIEIYINDGFSRALRLEAGTHNLYDLNIPTGLNRVKIKVIEDSGKIEYIEFNDFDYTELYKKGVSRFGIGVGISSKRDINDKIVYDDKEQFASIYGEYGLTSFLTIKVGTELKDDYQSAIVEPIIGTPIGLFDIYTIGSHQKEDDLDGYKYGLQYRTNIGSLNLSLSGEQTQREFRTMNSYDINNSTKSTMYRGAIYSPFLWDSSLSLSASKYKRERGDIDEQEQYSADIRKIITPNLNILMSYNYNKDITRDSDNHEIYLTLNYRYGDIDAKYSEYIKDDRHQLSLSHRTGDYYGLTSNLDLEDTPSNQRASIRADLRDEKFRFSTNYNYDAQKHSSADSQSLNAQFATGIYFAGDSFSISEPINDSYVIVENDDRLKDNSVGIVGYHNVDDNIYNSYIISSGDHQTRELEVNELNLPMGMDIVDFKQSFKSNYKSGSVMHIDVNSFYSVKGRLVDQNGEAIKLRAFKVYNTKTGAKEMAFSDENGDFLLSHIEIADYNAILFREKDAEELSKFSFSVKESKGMKNLIDIGEIKITLPENKKTKPLADKNST